MRFVSYSPVGAQAELSAFDLALLAEAIAKSDPMQYEDEAKGGALEALQAAFEAAARLLAQQTV